MVHNSFECVMHESQGVKIMFRTFRVKTHISRQKENFLLFSRKNKYFQVPK